MRLLYYGYWIVVAGFVTQFVAVGPVLVAYYYDLAGNYGLALMTIAVCNMASAVMLYLMKQPKVAIVLPDTVQSSSG